MNKYMFKVYYRDKTTLDFCRWSLRASFVYQRDAEKWMDYILSTEYGYDRDCEFKIMQYSARKKITATIKKYHGGYAALG